MGMYNSHRENEDNNCNQKSSIFVGFSAVGELKVDIVFMVTADTHNHQHLVSGMDSVFMALWSC